MAEMRSYVKVLQELLEDVIGRAAEARDREAKANETIREVSSEHAASTAELANIKKSFSFANWFKAKKKSGISAEEAREEAKRYSNYAEVVDQIAGEVQRIEEAKTLVAKAKEDITKREFVQQKVEDLMDVLGMIE